MKVDQLMNTIIKSEFGNIVYLRDVATVADSYKERNSYARLEVQTCRIAGCGEEVRARICWMPPTRSWQAYWHWRSAEHTFPAT
jgi:hypothetical protein